MRKAPKGGELDPLDEQINKIIAKVRAKVEHPFRVLKCQFGHVKTHYRGLAKNQMHLFTLFALGNLFMTRRRAVGDMRRSPPKIDKYAASAATTMRKSLQTGRMTLKYALKP